MERQIESGGKARGLELLLENTDLGFEVPRFSVVDTSYYNYIQKQQIMAGLLGAITQQPYSPVKLPKDFDGIVADLLNQFQGSILIARSSSLREDGKNSFAGIYNSEVVEDVTDVNLANALFSVYSSMETPKAVAYRQEHDIEDDKMAVVVQEFIEPDWSGVMYTSNPSYPKDLSIEFVAGRNRVVDGAEDSMIVDYNKANMKRVFESEYLPSDLPFDVDRLARMGVALEERVGASDVEFVVKDGQFYFIQRRDITDLQEPRRVRVPKYNPDQLLGVTKIKRGVGKVTLPVVKLSDISDLMDSMQLLNVVDPQKANDEIVDYFRNVVRKDEQFSEGYILLLPQFQATVMFGFQHYTLQAGIKGEPTYDNLTPHKKAILTTKFGGISSHAMTVARERGILYADFSHSSKHSLDRVETGDTISIYFLGRQAKVFLEASPLRSIHDTNPHVSFDITPIDEGYISVKTSTFLDSTKPYTNDFLLYLNNATGQEWRFEPFDGVMGGAFVNPEGRHILMNMHQMRGQYHGWGFSPPEHCRVMGYKSLTKKQLMPLIEGYVEHLRAK